MTLDITQAVLVEGSERDWDQASQRLALFDEEGNPVTFSGGGPTKVSTIIPSSWILDHSNDFATREVVPAVPGKIIIPFAAAAKLVFATTPYSGIGVDDTDIVLIYGDDATASDNFMQGGAMLDGFWNASEDSGMALAWSTGYQQVPLGKSLSMYLLGQGLEAGDSDVELSVFYYLLP